jgi:hypothetical protein
MQGLVSCYPVLVYPILGYALHRFYHLPDGVARRMSKLQASRALRSKRK